MDMKALSEWAVQYFRSRDAFTKSIQSLEVTKEGVLIRHKDREEKISVSPQLKDLQESTLKSSQIIVTLSSPENIEFMVKHWNVLKELNIKIHFLNQHSHKRWVLNPKAHSLVCDEKALKRGLQTLAEEA